MVYTPQHSFRLTVVTGFSLALALGACSSNSSGIGHSGGSTGAGGTIAGGGATRAAGVLATSVSSAAGTAGRSIASGGSSLPAGGSSNAGDASGGATSQSGGSTAGGGSAAEGGSAATGGNATSGGMTAAGGTMAGSTATGGAASGGGAGGTALSGGTVGGNSAAGATGGSAGTAGGRTGGSAATGGSVTTGGSKAAGGTTAAGGASGSGGASGGTATGGTTGAVGDAASFHCVNWADPGDNFQAGVLQPSGLSSSDTYATVLAKANAILSGFQTALSANSIRIPVNEPTVTSTAWWTAYKGLIDAAISKNMKVIVAYWYKPGVGTVPDMNAFYAMWQAVVDAYGTNDLVYFDVINEPSGYSPAAFINLVVAWMAKFPSVPHNRILVAGNYNDTDVNTQGADSRLAGCLLNIHIYAIGSTDTNPANWTTKLKNAVGPYANRTVVSEYGAPMTSGYDYGGAVNGTAFIAYMQAVTSQIRTSGMGSCYWPGLRNGDWYSMTTLKGTGTNLSLSVNSTSGLALIQSAWGM
jgi:Cellulase (glycosyl hydrolase family 5)